MLKDVIFAVTEYNNLQVLYSIATLSFLYWMWIRADTTHTTKTRARLYSNPFYYTDAKLTGDLFTYVRVCNEAHSDTLYCTGNSPKLTHKMRLSDIDL